MKPIKLGNCVCVCVCSEGVGVCVVRVCGWV